MCFSDLFLENKRKAAAALRLFEGPQAPWAPPWHNRTELGPSDLGVLLVKTKRLRWRLGEKPKKYCYIYRDISILIGIWKVVKSRNQDSKIKDTHLENAEDWCIWLGICETQQTRRGRPTCWNYPPVQVGLIWSTRAPRNPFILQILILQSSPKLSLLNSKSGSSSFFVAAIDQCFGDCNWSNWEKMEAPAPTSFNQWFVCLGHGTNHGSPWATESQVQLDVGNPAWIQLKSSSNGLIQLQKTRSMRKAGRWCRLKGGRHWFFAAWK